MKTSRLKFLQQFGVLVLGGPLAVHAMQAMSEPGSNIDEIALSRGTVTATVGGRDCWYDGSTWRWSDNNVSLGFCGIEVVAQ